MWERINPSLSGSFLKGKVASSHTGTETTSLTVRSWGEPVHKQTCDHSRYGCQPHLNELYVDQLTSSPVFGSHNGLCSSALPSHSSRPSLDSQAYHKFLANELLQLIEGMQLNVRANRWFQHDSTPTNFNSCVRQYLTNTFGVELLGIGGRAIATTLTRPQTIGGVAGSRPGASNVADLQFACCTGNFSTCWSNFSSSTTTTARQRPGVEGLLASDQGESGSIPGRVTPEFSHVLIMPDDIAGRRFFSGIILPPPFYTPTLLHTHLKHPHRPSIPHCRSNLTVLAKLQKERNVVAELAVVIERRTSYEDGNEAPPSNKTNNVLGAGVVRQATSKFSGNIPPRLRPRSLCLCLADSEFIRVGSSNSEKQKNGEEWVMSCSEEPSQKSHEVVYGSISNIDDGTDYNCSKAQKRKVISGVVGAASSVTSIQVANLLRLFKIPQVPPIARIPSNHFPTRISKTASSAHMMVVVGQSRFMTRSPGAGSLSLAIILYSSASWSGRGHQHFAKHRTSPWIAVMYISSRLVIHLTMATLHILHFFNSWHHDFRLAESTANNASGTYSSRKTHRWAPSTSRCRFLLFAQAGGRNIHGGYRHVCMSPTLYAETSALLAGSIFLGPGMLVRFLTRLGQLHGTVWCMDSCRRLSRGDGSVCCAAQYKLRCHVEHDTGRSPWAV
ncbi:hypothetical protein PR048_019928 [Dryococelus australis]|uniref:Uncharacterized protein n=1 Tax=Dryococelus australis TaxID=614101 RepID=A0ABQ9H4V4_9NEOP|nr:hypothetical protein PR048_019928 [Dryococelus australis]